MSDACYESENEAVLNGITGNVTYGAGPIGACGTTQAWPTGWSVDTIIGNVVTLRREQVPACVQMASVTIECCDNCVAAPDETFPFSLSAAGDEASSPFNVSASGPADCCYRVDITYEGVLVANADLTTTADFTIASDVGIDFKQSCGDINFASMNFEVVGLAGTTTPFNTTKTGYVCGGAPSAAFIIHAILNQNDASLSGAVTITITPVASGGCAT